MTETSSSLGHPEAVSTMTPEDWDRRYEGSRLLWTAEPNRFLVDEVGPMEPGRALDVVVAKEEARFGWRSGAGR